MTDKEKLTVETLRKRGLDNGTTLGWHAGICDEAADLIECLARERDAAVRDLKGISDDYVLCHWCKHLSDESDYCEGCRSHSN